MNKKRNKIRLMQTALIIGVVIIPLLYSFLYLGAFWDPYSRLETLPVAVVNNDVGAVINNEQRNLGQELCNTLNEDNSLKFIITDESAAKEGTEGDEYYAMIVIPSDFSADIATAGEVEKHTATITFSANEKRNYLASQILSKATLQVEEKLRSNVNKEITEQLANQLQNIPDQLTNLENGLKLINKGSLALKDGTESLKTGASKLADGTSTLSSKFLQYQAGVLNAKKGTDSLLNGVADLDNGLNVLLTGATQLESSTQSLTRLQQGAKDLANGAEAYNTSLIAYTDGVTALIKNVNDTSAFLTQYVAANPQLMQDQTFAAFIGKISGSKDNIQLLSAATEKIKTGSETISAGIAQLSEGTTSLSQVQTAITTIKNGLKQAKDGSQLLVNGTDQLSNGMSALSQATKQINTAISDLNNGADQLKDGTGTLNDGAAQLQTGIAAAENGVNSSVIDADTQLKNLNGIGDFAAEPVTVTTESINPVPNYGTAFAPYFLSLSLWVGAIIIFVGIFMDTEKRFTLLSRDSEKKGVRTFVYLLIGFTQAVVLAIVIKLCLGLEVNNIVLYFASCCLVSMVFLSIVQFLMVFLKDIGKFLSLFLLIIQLTSCGGTFPMETVPAFFNAVYKFMPMTYSVNLFKEAISGGNSSIIWTNAGILIGILVVFTSITVVFSKMKNKNK